MSKEKLVENFVAIICFLIVIGVIIAVTGQRKKCAQISQTINDDQPAVNYCENGYGEQIAITKGENSPTINIRK